MATKQEAPPVSTQLKRKRGDSYKSEASRAIGVSRQIYDTWESGHHIPGDEWAEQLAAYLDVPLRDVVLQLYIDRVTKKGRAPGAGLLSGLLVITWSDGEEADRKTGEWFRRPIDANLASGTLVAA